MSRFRTLRKFRRLTNWLTILIAFSVSAIGQSTQSRDVKSKVSLVSTYQIRMTDGESPRLQVQAALHIDGKKLSMDTTRSDDVPEVGKYGWPALIRDLKITDSSGRALAAKLVGPSGWELTESYSGNISLRYEIDYSGLAANNWPAPRETAFADNSHFVFVGRSAFITTSESARAKVDFTLPSGWHAITPWRVSSKAGFTVPATPDLVENLVVFTNSITDEVVVSGFRVRVTTMGQWEASRPEILKVLRGVIPVMYG